MRNWGLALIGGVATLGISLALVSAAHGHLNPAYLALQGQKALTSAGVLATPTIYIASDSTAAMYWPDKYPQMGWGMMLKCSLDAQVKVDDRAQGGRSARMFRTEGWMGKIDASIRSGDVLLIQFGHNDSAKGLPERYTPVPEFEQELTGYVEMARRHGAQPILITPLIKAQFAHDTLNNTLGDYAQAVREAAATTHTPLIDLNADTQAVLLAVGPLETARWYMPDNTHLTELGARMAASLIALRMGGLGLPISSHVKLSVAANAAVMKSGDCPARPQD